MWQLLRDRRARILLPQWSFYLWELVVLVMAVRRFPDHAVLDIGAVFILRAIMPWVVGGLGASIDTWPLVTAWRRVLGGLTLASVGVLLVPGPVWWLAVAALEAGQALAKPLGRKVLYAGLEGDARKRWVTWMGTVENIAMPTAYALILTAGPVAGIVVMIGSYGLAAWAGGAMSPERSMAAPPRKPAYAALWHTTWAHPVARRLWWKIVMFALVVPPINAIGGLVVLSRFHVPEAWVGFLFAGLSFGAIGGYRYADRLPERRSLVVVAVGFLGLATSPDLFLATLSMAVIGMGYGAFVAVQRQTVATQIPDDQRGQIQLLRQQGTAAGTAVGTAVVLGLWAVAPAIAWLALCLGAGGLAVVPYVGGRSSWSTALLS